MIKICTVHHTILQTQRTSPFFSAYIYYLLTTHKLYHSAPQSRYCCVRSQNSGCQPARLETCAMLTHPWLQCCPHHHFLQQMPSCPNNDQPQTSDRWLGIVMTEKGTQLLLAAQADEIKQMSIPLVHSVDQAVLINLM